EVADVAAGVDGEPAGVHPDGLVRAWLELFFAAGQRVVEPQRHGNGRRVRHSAAPSWATTISISAARTAMRTVHGRRPASAAPPSAARTSATSASTAGRVRPK